MFTIEQLTCFVAVAEELSFKRAAERLVMTQPPLSRQIQRLEQDLGFGLLTRTTRSVQLTPAGDVFLERAREILQLCRDSPAAARGVAEGTGGRVRVGFTAVAALGILSDWLKAMRTHYPAVDIALSEAVTDRQVDLLLSGEIDVAFLRGQPRSPLLSTRLIHAEPLVVAMPAGHELARLGRSPALVEIAQHTLIGYSPAPGRYFHELAISVFQQADCQPERTQYVNEISSILLLVEAGLGVALVPRSARGLRNSGAITYLPIADLPDHVVKMRAAWRTDNHDPTTQSALSLVPLLNQS